MMSTRRTLLVFGGLLAVGVLLAPQTAFAQPAAVTVDDRDITHNSIGVEWTQPASNPEDVEMYEVAWEVITADDDVAITPNPAPTMMMQVGAHLREATIEGLDPETTYNVGVRTLTFAADRSEWVVASPNPKTKEAPPEPEAPEAPDAPVIQSAMPGWDWTIDVMWEAVDDADQYMVEWKKESQSYGADDRMVTVTGTSHTITGAAADTVYMVRVSAGNMGTYGDPSGDATVRMPTEITEKPMVTVTPGNKELTVEWTAVTGGTWYCVEWGVGNRIVRSGNQYCSGVSTHRTSGERTYKITTYDGAALKNGTEYVVQVRGNNASGRGPVSDRVNGTPTTVGTTAPGAPAIDLMSGDSMIMVSWDAVDGATKYMVQWSSAAQSFGATDRTAEVMEGTSYDITGLENGTEYKVRVRAGNKDHGYGDWSGEAMAMPMMPTPALPVFGVLALGAGLVAAGRRRLRGRREPRLLKS